MSDIHDESQAKIRVPKNSWEEMIEIEAKHPPFIGTKLGNLVPRADFDEALALLKLTNPPSEQCRVCHCPYSHVMDTIPQIVTYMHTENCRLSVLFKKWGTK